MLNALKPFLVNCLAGGLACAVLAVGGVPLLHAAANPTGLHAAAVPATLRIAVATPAKTLDPLLAADAASARVLQLTHPALLRLDDTFQPAPYVGSCTAASRSITCSIPTGLTFTGGPALTAPGVKEWYTLVQATPRSPGAAALQQVSITAPTSTTLVFTTASPTAALVQALTEIPLSVPATTRPGLGAAMGLYTLVHQGVQQELTLAPANPASPTLKIIPLADATTRLLKLKNNEVDVVLNDVPPELYAWGLQQGFGGLAVPSTSTSYLAVNFKNPYLSGLSVRQALLLATNRAAIRSKLLGGLAAVPTSLLPPGHPLAWPAPEPPFDPFTAEALLDEAGFLRGPDNVRFTLTLATSTDALSQRVAQVIQAQWGAVGVQVQLRPSEWASFFGAVQKGQFDVALLSWAGVQTPAAYFNLFHSSQVPPGGLNRGRVNLPTLDVAGAAIQAATTATELATATRHAQAVVAETLPYLTLYRRHHTLLAAPGVHGCALPPTGAYLGLAGCQHQGQAQPR